MNTQSPNALMTELFNILKKPIASFVFSRFSGKYPEDLRATMENYLRTNQNARKVMQENPLFFEQRDDFIKHMDIHSTLHLMEKGWADVFEDYPDSMREGVSILLKKRNAWAHQKEMTTEDVQEVIEIAMHLLNKMNTTSAKKAVRKMSRLMATRQDYYQHIRLPGHYIPRIDLLGQVKREMLSNPDTSVIALHGMGGIGKSVMARALCNDEEVQERFPDGILWISVGNQADEHELKRKILDWIDVLNGSGDIIKPPSLEVLKHRLAELLNDRSCLLVLDDVWRKSHFEALHVGGTKCRTMITTRDAEIARDMGARLVPVSMMDETLAIELLEKWSQGGLEAASAEMKRKVVKRLGGLPLAVKLAGAQLRSKPIQTWLENFDVRKLKSNRPEHVHDCLEKTFGLSLDMLGESERKLYAALSIFKKNIAVQEVFVVHLWESLSQISPDSAQDLVADFASRALCEVIDDGFSRAILLHDLLTDFMKHEVEDAKGVHRALLSVYEKAQTGKGWHTVPDDGYFYAFSGYHFQQADALDTLRQVLLSYNFLQKKLNVAGLMALLTDYDYLSDDPVMDLIKSTLILNSDVHDRPEQLPVCLYASLMSHRDMYPEIATLVQDCYNTPEPLLFAMRTTQKSAISVVSYVDDDDRLHLWRSQTEDFSEQDMELLKQQAALFEHLSSSPDFQSMLEETLQSFEGIANEEEHGDDVKKSTLKNPVVSSRFTIGRPLEHFGAVNAIALWEEFAVTASDDKTVKVWDWRTGKELRTFKGHNAPVLSVAFSGEFVKSVSSDGVVKIWDRHTGEEQQTDETKSDIIFAETVLFGQCAITPYDDTVKVWNRQTGEDITLFFADSPQKVVAIAPDASVIISGGQDGRIHFLHPNPALMTILLENR